MIKKIYKLTLNELIKEYKKKTIVILSILILLSAIFVPFLVKELEDSTDSLNVSIQNSNIEYNESSLKNLDTTTINGKIQKVVLESQLKQAKFDKEYNVGFNDWKSDDSHKYLNSLLLMDIITLRKENISTVDILGNPTLNNTPLAQEIAALPKEELDSIFAKLNTQSEDLLNNIKTNNYLGFVNQEIDTTKSSIVDINKTINKLEQQVKANPNNLELQEQLVTEKTQLSATSEHLKTLEFRYNNKVPFDNSNWKNNTLNAMQTAITNANNPIMTQAQFISKPIPKLTYDRYNTKMQLLKTNAQNELKKDWYSLNNNIPQQQYTLSAQSTVNSFIGTYSIIITLFIIIIAGGIVSSEFSRNTIKLLLVRPVSRFKVLLSKLLAVYIIGYVLLFASMIIILISSGFIFGFDGLGSSVLKISNGNIYTQSYAVYFILHILFYSISLLCAGALSFMLSTITKSTAVSVATSIILYIGLPIVTVIMLLNDYYWFALTPFAYFNTSGALTAQSMIDNPSLQNFSIMHVNTGTLSILVLAFILCIISFVKFIKSDIR